jgi:glyoxylase-like metal-dependent hydrolase (beta-lactamase superfamily II)
MKQIKRRNFITVAIGVVGCSLVGCAKKMLPANTENAYRLKGKKSSKIIHWDIVTIGNLSRNRYWGESEEKSLHSVICTTTVISGKDFHVIVDPSLADSKAMADELKRRTGLTPDDIDVAFVTHEHGDHHCGLPAFLKARWLATAEAASIINNTNKYPKKVEVVGKTIYDVIDVVPTPGHTPGTAGLRFDYRGLSIFVAGDAIATKDFWDEGRIYFKALDVEIAKQSMKEIASFSNIVVPGHDNYFINID